MFSFRGNGNLSEFHRLKTGMKMAGTHLWLGVLATTFLAGSAFAAPVKKGDTTVPVTQARETYGKISWLARHEQILERNKVVKPGIVFLGDSITHYWGGEPTAHRRTGETSWSRLTAGRVATNLGFGFDYIENALWRVQHGELDGIAPRVIVINLGTNNLGHKKDSPSDCARGMKALLSEIRKKQPAAKILLLGIYPRHERALAGALAETNLLYLKLGDENVVSFTDFGEALASPHESGTPRMPDPTLFSDGLHPNAAGYAVIAERLIPEIEKLYPKTP